MPTSLLDLFAALVLTGGLLGATLSRRPAFPLAATTVAALLAGSVTAVVFLGETLRQALVVTGPALLRHGAAAQAPPDWLQLQPLLTMTALVLLAPALTVLARTAGRRRTAVATP